MNYKYITEHFFQWTIHTGNYSPLSNQKGANLCVKCTEIRLVAKPGPAEPLEDYALRRPASRNGGSTSTGRGEGLLLRRTERRERRREGTEIEGKGIPPMSR